MRRDEEHAVSETRLPAGKYWLGDPCYAFGDHEVWMALLESANYLENPRILEGAAKGESFVASGTAWGDGVFHDQDGNEYGVDAGLIGVVPARDGEAVPSGLREVELRDPFFVEYESGKIKVGPLVIDTDPQDEGDYDECARCGTEVEGSDYCDSCESYIAGAE